MEKASGGIQVIARAGAILRAVGRDRISLGALARATGLPRSTVQRIVDALAREYLLDAGENGVCLGSGLHALAQRARMHIADQAAAPLARLAERTGESVDLACREGTDVIFVSRIISSHELRVAPASNRPCPVHAMANGKALLALLDDDDVAALLDSPGFSLHALTPHTVTGLARLLSELATIRRTGIAYDMEEHAEGVCAMSMAIDVPGVRPHALSIAVPASRFESGRVKCESALRSCLGELEDALRQTS